MISKAHCRPGQSHGRDGHDHPRAALPSLTSRSCMMGISSSSFANQKQTERLVTILGGAGYQGVFAGRQGEAEGGG